MQSCAILLTIFFEPARRAMYTRRIRWWSQRTRAPDELFVVDSYGVYSNARHLADNVLSYNQSHAFSSRVSSTTAELLALRNACRRWSHKFQRHGHVFKVTGKYVVPSLLPWYHTTTVAPQIWLQFRGESNTEILGVAPSVLDELLQRMSEIHARQRVCMEVALMYTVQRSSPSYRIRRMPWHPVPVTYRVPRASGDTLPYL